MPPSLRRAFKRPPLRQRADARIHLALGDINTGDNQTVLCHHPAPFLARFGLKAHATVRVEEDTGSVPRSPSGSQPLSTNGLRSSDGRLVRTARSHIRCLQPAKPDNRHFRDYPPTGRDANMPKSTQMTRTGSRAY